MKNYKNHNGVFWMHHHQQGRIFNLAHLHPFNHSFIQDAKGANPAIVYEFRVMFSLHCFTRQKGNDEEVSSDCFYSDSRETRVFCEERYQLSKHLPEIIKGLGKKKVLNTGHDNFMVVELVGPKGESIDYEVYFTVSRSSVKGRLNLFVNSAYPRTRGSRQKGLKPIGFYVILFNTMKNKPIRY